MILGTASPVALHHQHVGRLEVAVDHALLVRVLHSVSDLQEQFQPSARAQPVEIAGTE